MQASVSYIKSIDAVKRSTKRWSPNRAYRPALIPVNAKLSRVIILNMLSTITDIILINAIQISWRVSFCQLL